MIELLNFTKYTNGGYARTRTRSRCLNMRGDGKDDWEGIILVVVEREAAVLIAAEVEEGEGGGVGKGATRLYMMIT